MRAVVIVPAVLSPWLPTIRGRFVPFPAKAYTRRGGGGVLKTAWFLTHRIREAMNEKSGAVLQRDGGTVRLTKPMWARRRKIAPTSLQAQADRHDFG
jgi:hypothetical protein